MDKNSQGRGDGNYACPICGKVFSSLKAVHGHQRVHKDDIKNNSPPPTQNPYDDDEAFLSPGKKAEKEEGEITSDDDSQCAGTLECATKDGSAPDETEFKMEDFSPDKYEAAVALLMLQYRFGARGGVCSSSTASDSKDPQENHKTEEKVNVEAQTVAAPKQENSTASSGDGDGSREAQTIASPRQENSTGSIGDDDGSRVFKCPRCPKSYRTQQAFGGHMAGHNNTDRKAAAMAEGGTSSSAQVIKEHKCNICDATFQSGQALGGHMRKHLLAKEKVVVDVDNHQPETTQVDNQKDDGVAAETVKKEVAEDVITEEIHERNDRKKRLRLMLDLNLEPIDIDDD